MIYLRKGETFADLAAGRIWGIIRELAASGLVVLADKGYIAAGEHVHSPYRERTSPPPTRPSTARTPSCNLRTSAPAPSKYTHPIRRAQFSHILNEGSRETQTT